jgi:nicotinate-nucleotide--dimethylbenzimidazole phosphoribosyltransferase
MSHEKADAMTDSKQIEAKTRAYLDSLAKPPGALGRFEDLAASLAVASGDLRPIVLPRALVVFAADHGAVASGVSIWPQSVSAAVAKTFLAGKAAASVMAAATNTSARLVDVGLVGAPLAAHPSLTSERVCAGTRDMAFESALTVSEFSRALSVGRSAAAIEIQQGAKLLIGGEIGIGNTTAAAATIALLCDVPLANVLGPGAGANPISLAAKEQVLTAALDRARAQSDRTAQIAAVSGLEIAALAGFYMEAAAGGVPIVLDGVIASASALIARELMPGCQTRLIAAHLSPEPGHARALKQLGLAPFLDWGMRLGEGTGALALIPHLDIAAALLRDMARLDEALALANG